MSKCKTPSRYGEQYYVLLHVGEGEKQHGVKRPERMAAEAKAKAQQTCPVQPPKYNHGFSS